MDGRREVQIDVSGDGEGSTGSRDVAKVILEIRLVYQEARRRKSPRRSGSEDDRDETVSSQAGRRVLVAKSSACRGI